MRRLKLVIIGAALAMFMFDVFTFGIPAGLIGTSDVGAGLTGSVGMGFLAAVLSTPCSFGILAAAFAWAQAQGLALGTLAIMVIGKIARSMM